MAPRALNASCRSPLATTQRETCMSDNIHKVKRLSVHRRLAWKKPQRARSRAAKTIQNLDSKCRKPGPHQGRWCGALSGEAQSRLPARRAGFLLVPSERPLTQGVDLVSKERTHEAYSTCDRYRDDRRDGCRIRTIDRAPHGPPYGAAGSQKFRIKELAGITDAGAEFAPSLWMMLVVL